MKNTRDEFRREVVRILQERVGSRCSNPKCRCLTSGPNHAPEKSTRIGVAAHITAAAAGGPRYDALLTAEQRSSISNGIWLCQNCGKLIDSDPVTYSVETLISWRDEAENQARQELEGGFVPILPLEADEGWVCPFCGTVVKHGLKVCLGCHAEVVYGATRLEREEAAKIGFFTGGVAAGLLVYVLPGWLASSLSLNLSAGWGFGVYSLLPVAVSAMVAGRSLALYEDRKRRRVAPRFVRSSIGNH